ncbi:MAG: hypothetical protein N2040_04455 [Caldimonas manganoxidans]|nr:hypothetical protein [Caldimonas manganoxidans]
MAGSSLAWSVTELQHLLLAQPKRAIPFEEVRESPWLVTPRISRGTLHTSARGLEKRTIEPRSETWRLLDDRLEWSSSDGQPVRRVLYADAPAIAALAIALRRTVMGELKALQGDFHIEVEGNASLWNARLRPRHPDVARSLDLIELQGSQSRLQVIIVHERSGERSTIRLQY